MRKRFTGPAGLLREAEEYAKRDNRTLSELVCEALRQHIRRYPKSRDVRPSKGLEGRIAKLERIVRQGYPQVHPRAKPGQG